MWLSALLLAALATSGCGGGSGGGVGEIKTSDGAYPITKVEVADRYPADCSSGCLIGAPGSSSSSQRLPEGTQLVVVSTKEPEGAKALNDLCPGEAISVVADDGSKHSCTAVGSSMSTGGKAGTLDLLFVTPVSAKGFVLHAPDNPPIDLGA